MTSDRDISYKVLKSPHRVRPVLVPLVKDIFSNTLVTLQDKAHAAGSKELTEFFSPTRLGTYLPIQHTIILDTLEEFLSITLRNGEKAMDGLPVFREFSCQLSVVMSKLSGSNISEDAVQKVAKDYRSVSADFRLFEIPFSKHIPFTTAWQGRRAVRAIQEEFTRCAAR